MTDLEVTRFGPRQDPRLGRHRVHDPRSRSFPMRTTVDTSTWRTKSIRLYDPTPNPNQVIGNCTGCAKMMQFNAVGNRQTGTILRMADADKVYSLATTLDPWPGSWEPDDTGSSSLAAAKAAQQLGLGGEYRWIFNGADGVVQAVMEGHVVNIGSRWDWNMFEKDAFGRIEPGGGVAGGHEWTVRGYNETADLVLGRCWWGPDFRDFWIRREHLDDLLHDEGDAHTQTRTI